METLKGLSEKYAQRDDLYTENGEYTKTTIINAFNDGAKAMLQVIGFSLAAHQHKEIKVTTKKEREWLIEQINKTNMDAKELRVGNKIWRLCCYDEVVEIREHGIIGLDSLRGIISFGEIEPIPITDELLLKCGFKQCGYLFKTLFIEMYEVEKGWHLHIDNERFETALSITIKYVHQLQNAYYLATGKELEIKL